MDKRLSSRGRSWVDMSTAALHYREVPDVAHLIDFETILFYIYRLIYLCRLEFRLSRKHYEAFNVLLTTMENVVCCNRHTFL
jgi:hypothetical protein